MVLLNIVAWLVSKGFKWHYGLDCDDTFGHVVMPKTILLLLSMIVSKQWDLWLLDIENAFLLGVLDEEVYMCR
jgi:hypothetical protein